MSGAYKETDVARVRDGQSSEGVDRVATEEPLEVRLHGRPFAVIMRTPGADRELAAGFLFAEGVLKSADDLGTIEHCTDPSPRHPITPSPRHSVTPSPHDSVRPPLENVLNVTLAGGSLADLDRVLDQRRQVMGNTSCGMCGRLTIESLEVRAAPLASDGRISSAAVLGMPALLRAEQRTFDETGGLHAAGLFTAAGVLDVFAEDVGRHNAVDKVIGRMLMKDALPLSDHVLFVSGRTSFEIVQKALLAGIPIVGAVSAPSSLAVELAAAFGVTLLGFVRDGGCNIYAHPERIVTSASTSVSPLRR